MNEEQLRDIFSNNNLYEDFFEKLVDQIDEVRLNGKLKKAYKNVSDAKYNVSEMNEFEILYINATLNK